MIAYAKYRTLVKHPARGGFHGTSHPTAVGLAAHVDPRDPVYPQDLVDPLEPVDLPMTLIHGSLVNPINIAILHVNTLDNRGMVQEVLFHDSNRTALHQGGGWELMCLLMQLNQLINHCILLFRRYISFLQVTLHLYYLRTPVQMLLLHLFCLHTPV